MLMSIFNTEQKKVSFYFSANKYWRIKYKHEKCTYKKKKKRKMGNGILSHWKTEPLTCMWWCCPLNSLFSLFMGKVPLLQWKDFWFHIISTFRDHYSCQVNPRWLGLTYLMTPEDNLLTELKKKTIHVNTPTADWKRICFSIAEDCFMCMRLPSRVRNVFCD